MDQGVQNPLRNHRHDSQTLTLRSQPRLLETILWYIFYTCLAGRAAFTTAFKDCEIRTNVPLNSAKDFTFRISFIISIIPFPASLTFRFSRMEGLISAERGRTETSAAYETEGTEVISSFGSIWTSGVVFQLWICWMDPSRFITINAGCTIKKSPYLKTPNECSK